MTILAEAGRGNDASRLTADDCFIALGPARLTLPSKADHCLKRLKSDCRSSFREAGIHHRCMKFEGGPPPSRQMKGAGA
jgi:hypothetical protein